MGTLSSRGAYFDFETANASSRSDKAHNLLEDIPMESNISVEWQQRQHTPRSDTNKIAELDNPYETNAKEALQCELENEWQEYTKRKKVDKLPYTTPQTYATPQACDSTESALDVLTTRRNQRPDLEQTKLCWNFLKNQPCYFEPKCWYSHDPDLLRKWREERGENRLIFAEEIREPRYDPPPPVPVVVPLKENDGKKTLGKSYWGPLVPSQTPTPEVPAKIDSPRPDPIESPGMRFLQRTHRREMSFLQKWGIATEQGIELLAFATDEQKEMAYTYFKPSLKDGTATVQDLRNLLERCEDSKTVSTAPGSGSSPSDSRRMSSKVTSPVNLRQNGWEDFLSMHT